MTKCKSFRAAFRVRHLGLLGYRGFKFKTVACLAPGYHEIRLCSFSTTHGLPVCNGVSVLRLGGLDPPTLLHADVCFVASSREELLL